VLPFTFKINKTILLITTIINAYVILISGSRTTYVALIVFLIYFALFKTSRFVAFGLVFILLSLAIITIDNSIYEKVEEVIEGRVINKIKNKDDLANQKVGDLYEDLGSGREALTESNALFILENPAIIPFGAGFNNWIIGGGGKSAHNMYLQIIKEMGLVGFVLYFGWLINYLIIDFKKYQGFSVALKGLVIAMLVTLFFGETLYIYRPLFGLLGLFLFITTIFISILHQNEVTTKYK
jgi:O-antigen ligase